jgi:hypothetical protein
MLCISLILIVVPAIKALNCPNFYDYTKETVQCATVCPSDSNTKNNKCLAKSQYLIGQEVHLCERGWVDSQNSICCSRDQYISTVDNIASCAQCNTRPYLNGKICCPGSYYADLSNADSPKCTPIGSGLCGSITMRKLFKVCCPSGFFYSL